MNEREKAALAVHGNCARLKHLLRRAQAGDELVIGFLGGSITQGSLASKPENCYAARVYRWWCEKFLQSHFSYVNAGIGGTTSLFGAARAQEDLIRFRPDFVIIDFSVNDERTPFFQETFEGVVRQVYGGDKRPAVMILNNVFYDSGNSAEDLHNRIGEYYQIPCVSMRSSLYRMICEGVYRESDITQDHLHPNDVGHALVADMLISQLEEIYRNLETEEEEPKYPGPLTTNRFEFAKRFQAANVQPEQKGFPADTREKTGMLDLFKNGWVGSRNGDKITFRLNACSCIAVQFLRSIKKPRPVACAVTDGDNAHAVILDGNFEEDWGDCLALLPVLDEEKRMEHTLEITINESHAEDAGGFYLVSVITD